VGLPFHNTWISVILRLESKENERPALTAMMNDLRTRKADVVVGTNEGITQQDQDSWLPLVAQGSFWCCVGLVAICVVGSLWKSD
jgi:hypothetical protein